MAAGPSRDDRPSISQPNPRRTFFSTYRPVNHIEFSIGKDKYFTCVKFTHEERSVVAGSHDGKIFQYDVLSGDRDIMFDTGTGEILNIEPHKTGKFVLSSSKEDEDTYYSHLWNLENQTVKFKMDDQQHAEFNHAQTRIVCSNGNKAKLYDVVTGKRKCTFTSSNKNRYAINKATFDTKDKLILSNGALFDIASGKQIHKFVKLNETQNGVFHPNGLEMISDSAIYDLRTYSLRRTIEHLYKHTVIFSPKENILYKKKLPEYIESEWRYTTKFVPVDETADYSGIAKVDVGRKIFDMAINKSETQLAVVTNEGSCDRFECRSQVILLEVGKPTDQSHQDFKLIITPL